MAKTESIKVKDLVLDLKNYRTVRQKSELSAVQAMHSVSPDKFVALIESLLTDGYLPTENIIVLETAGKHVVKEGNRRVAALKMIHGLIPVDKVELSRELKAKIRAAGAAWKTQNASVPCAVYPMKDVKYVEKIVRLTHAKAEKASRDKWTSVAGARHNRDEKGASEQGLDLLEKYLEEGKNLSQHQKERWSGVYPLTVLDEAIKQLAPRMGYENSKKLVLAYPDKMDYRTAMEGILRDIGLGMIDFPAIRSDSYDFAARFGVPAPKPEPKKDGEGEKKPGGGKGKGDKPKKPAKPKAIPLNDPKSVIMVMRRFTPLGENREKVATLAREAGKLKLEDHPHSFCFLLRSMFEISAKEYCVEDSRSIPLTRTTKKGETYDRPLVEILKDVTTHITNGNKDKDKKKALHGAITELSKSAGILSVTSMNQLVHNSRFSVTASDISVLFHQVFPLLEELNS